MGGASSRLPRHGPSTVECRFPKTPTELRRIEKLAHRLRDDGIIPWLHEDPAAFQELRKRALGRCDHGRATCGALDGRKPKPLTLRGKHDSGRTRMQMSQLVVRHEAGPVDVHSGSQVGDERPQALQLTKEDVSAGATNEQQLWDAPLPSLALLFATDCRVSTDDRVDPFVRVETAHVHKVLRP